ncbi:MAG: hypothetical protein F4059_04535, partial [Gemmatimonadetes bacterium]|nr:hypothetical protein [Gemmatimonadota bacterium]
MKRPRAAKLLPLFGLALVAALGAFGWLNQIGLPLPRLLLPAAAFLAYGAAGLITGRTAGRANRGRPGATADRGDRGAPADAGGGSTRPAPSIA